MKEDLREIQELQDRATISVNKVRSLVESWVPKDACLPNALLSSIEKRPMSLYKPSATSSKAQGHAGQARLKGALLATGKPKDGHIQSSSNRNDLAMDDDEQQESKAASAPSKKRPLGNNDALSQYLSGGKNKKKSKRK